MKYIDVEMGTGSEINSLLNDQFLNIDPFSNLAETLRKSGQFTIDEFLNTHKSLIPFGKLMITYILLRTEREEFLLKDEWCQLIWSRLAKGKLSPKEINPDIGFITFNYDTSLEYIFSENLINTFPEATHEDVCAFFENVPLLHIHGKIKNLSWEKENEKTNMKILGLPQFDSVEVARMSRGIRLFHEPGENAVINRAKELIEVAEKIVFLGFGFDPINLSKLNTISARWIKNRISPTNIEFVTGRRKFPPRETGRMVNESTFAGKSLFATGIGLGEQRKMDIKKNEGLRGLKFVDYESIYDFLDAHLEEFL
jgi:hypothetical protein